MCHVLQVTNASNQGMNIFITIEVFCYLPCWLVPSSHSTWIRWVVPRRQTKSILIHAPHLCIKRIASSNFMGIPNQASSTIISKKTATSQKIIWGFMRTITVESDSSLLRSLPTNENNILFITRATNHVCLLTTINLPCHLENHLSWIDGWNPSLKILLFLHVHKDQQVTMKKSRNLI